MKQKFSCLCNLVVIRKYSYFRAWAYFCYIGYRLFIQKKILVLTDLKRSCYFFWVKYFTPWNNLVYAIFIGEWNISCRCRQSCVRKIQICGTRDSAERFENYSGSQQFCLATLNVLPLNDWTSVTERNHFITRHSITLIKPPLWNLIQLGSKHPRYDRKIVK